MNIIHTTIPGEADTCQEPGDAICYLAEFNIIVGDPCCAESACLPFPFGDPIETNNFCQFLAKIPADGECGVRRQKNEL